MFMLRFSPGHGCHFGPLTPDRNGLDNNGLFMNLLPRKLPLDTAIAFSKLTKQPADKTESRCCSSRSLPPQSAHITEALSILQPERSGGEDRRAAARLPACGPVNSDAGYKTGSLTAVQATLISN